MKYIIQYQYVGDFGSRESYKDTKEEAEAFVLALLRDRCVKSSLVAYELVKREIREEVVTKISIG